MAVVSDRVWRMGKIASRVVGRYNDPKSTESLTFSLKNNGKDGMELVLCLFADRDLNSLVSVQRVLINER